MSRHGHINDILPGELLCRIFRLCLDPCYLKRDRCRLSLVCRLWCGWVQGSASLWTDIIASEGLGYLRKSIERSKDAPIELSYPGETRTVCVIRVDKFLQEASPHVARWRSLSIVPSYPVNWEETLAPLEAKRVPNLETLHLFGRTSSLHTPTGSTTITIGDPDGAFPKLRNISLRNVPVTIHVTGLTTLRSFVLIEMPEVSLRAVVGVLENSPQVEQLEVADCKGLKIAEKNWSVHLIKFERLTGVVLAGLDAAVTNFSLSIVHAPNCERLIVTCKITDPPPHSDLFNASVSHLLLPFRKDGLERPLIDVVVEEEDGNGYISIRVGYISIEICVSTDGASSRLNNVLRWIGDYSGSEASYPVSLAFYLDFLDTGYVEAFGPQSSVKHIDVFADSQDVLLEYLSHPRPQNSSGWPFPRLEELDCHLRLLETGTPLLDMLTARYGRAGTEQSVEAETPKPLRSIKAYSRTRPDEIIRRIQEILSNVEITWVRAW
ncbi:hypothetical protein FRC04_008083 [Tulasnella sp. 424]|nr:hypothetical protein FRC04_008083 [Tulasnella sp. 424]KAG8974740.1 hypothetical protein FRC05_006900 [Tulasnella sp. 425]